MNHLRKHGITRHGNKTPRTFRDSLYNSTADTLQPAEPIRQPESYVDLTSVVLMKPFKEALVAFVVICQLSFGLIVNQLFVELLKTLYPKIDKLLPSASDTIRRWIMDAFEARKEQLKAELARSQSMIHFSFDLWTSPNHLALLGVVAHYIDEYGQNRSVSIHVRTSVM